VENSSDAPPSDTRPQGTPLSTILIGGGLALAVVLYASIYVVQSANVSRYQEGFVLTICPICQDGNLHVEDRRHRILGIPRVRRVVRCDVCRSVLRQVGPQRWRYAVDGAENQELYQEFNGRVVSEEQLIAISPEYQGQPPEFIEGDDMS
jgi:hypothetical protein